MPYDSIFVAQLSETALTAASLVYAIQFLMIAIGVGTAVGLNVLLSRKLGQKKPEEACRAATTGLFLMLGTSLVFTLLGLFSASDEMLAFGVPVLRIISVTFLFAVTTILCGYFASGLGNGVVNMIGGALRQLVVLVPCLWLLLRTMGIEKAWFAFWVSEVTACAYSLWATKKELRNKGK